LGAAGAVYVGGKLEQNPPTSPLRYNPGRGSQHDTCKGWSRATACKQADSLFFFLRFTNTKVFLSANNAFSNCGKCSEIVGFQFHGVGMSGNLLGVLWMANGVMACRTGLPLQLPCVGCDTDAAKAAGILKGMEGTGFGWYDTGLQHILSNITFRSCGISEPKRALALGCGNGKGGCQPLSSVIKFNSGSDRFAPQMLQATRELRPPLPLHMARAKLRSSLAERLVNKYDADGTASGRKKPTIMGAITADSNGWWNLALGAKAMSVADAPWGVDKECTYSFEGPIIHCDAATGRRSIASFFMQWKLNQRADVGAAAGLCDRNKPCTPEGSIGHWGYAAALLVTRNSQVTGPFGGFGWHIKFNAGAPRTLQFTEIQMFKASPLMLSIAYPKGVRFTITARGPPWCRPLPSLSCKHIFHGVPSIQAVRNSLGDAYYVDEAGILYMRLVQPPDRNTGSPDWKLSEWPNPPFMRAGLAIPTKSSTYEHIEIAVDCATSKSQ
jgi:hypothetical protein